MKTIIIKYIPADLSNVGDDNLYYNGEWYYFERKDYISTINIILSRSCVKWDYVKVINERTNKVIYKSYVVNGRIATKEERVEIKKNNMIAKLAGLAGNKINVVNKNKINVEDVIKNCSKIDLMNVSLMANGNYLCEFEFDGLAVNLWCNGKVFSYLDGDDEKIIDPSIATELKEMRDWVFGL